MTNDPKTTGQGRTDRGSSSGTHEIEAPDTHRSDSKGATMGERDQQGKNPNQNQPQGKGDSSGTSGGNASPSAPGRPGATPSSDRGSNDPAGRPVDASKEGRERDGAGCGIAGAANAGADKSRDGANPQSGGKKNT